MLIPVIYLILYWIGAFFIVYHLTKYGITPWPKKIATVFLAGALMLSILNFMLFTQVNWKTIFNPQNLQQNFNTKTN